MTITEEQQVIRRVLGGQKDAFEELVLANEKNVYNLSLRMLGSEEDALDVSQEAFLKAYMRLGGFRGESRFSVWLYRLTYNLCVDLIRKKPNASIISLTYKTGDEAGRDIEIPDEGETPESAVLAKEKREAIAEGIQLLGRMHKEILLMREISEMSYEEIGAALGINEGTVKSRLARARKALADRLAAKGTFPENFRQKDKTSLEGGGEE